MIPKTTIIVGDGRKRLREQPPQSVHCVITSPPYWSLRSYDTEPQVWGGDDDCAHDWVDATVKCSRHTDVGAGEKQLTNAGSVGHRTERPGGFCSKCGAWLGELGAEPTPELYVRNIVLFFREVACVLRDDGTLFLNIGDTYCTAPSGGIGTASTLTGSHDRQLAYRKARRNRASARRDKVVTGEERNKSGPGLKPKDLVGIPWEVALAMRRDGWYLRCELPWIKRNGLPDSTADRPSRSLEYVFLFAKSERYFFDMEAVRNGRQFRNGDFWFESVEAPYGMTFLDDEPVGLDVTVSTIRKNHFATFPPKLVEPLIKCGTSEKGCCSACGAQWVRILEDLPTPDRQDYDGKNRLVDPQSKTRRMLSAVRAARALRGDHDNPFAQRRTVVWQPSCDCNADRVPAVVCDPFSGAGTTGLVARPLGRDYLGFELNEEYAAMSRARIAAGYDAKATERPIAGQRELF